MKDADAKFTISKKEIENMVAIGTCTSKNLLRWLRHYRIYMQQPIWDIIFNPYVIEEELYRIFIGEDWNNYYCTDGYYRDNIRSWITFEKYGEYQNYTLQKNSMIKEALDNIDCVFISLGVLEAWKHKNRFINYVPSAAQLNSGSFSCIDVSYVLAEQAIDRIIQYIRKYLGKNCKIILTVCPVSQKFTYSKKLTQDVNLRTKKYLSQICISKSDNYDTVSYFPAYDYVFTHASKNEMLQLDNRHITAKGLEELYLFFMKYYNVNATMEKDSQFWVPGHDCKGSIIGKLYVDGRLEKNTDFIKSHVII